VVRPEFRRLLECLEQRRIDALITYDLDRLARDPRDLEDLIDIKETFGCQVKSVTGSLRLDSDADVTMARVMVAIANKTSRDTSRRVARRAQQRAEEGRWHGGWAPCGYEWARDSTGTITGLQECPERAELLREGARRVLAGETLYAIAKDFNARGLRTAPSATMPDGTRWLPATLKRSLTSPAVAGKRSHKGNLLDGQWSALLDQETWQRLRDILLDPRRAERSGGFRSTARKHLLSGLTTCGCECTGQPCGARLVAQPYNGKPTMVCARAFGGCGHIRINYVPVEAHVLGQLRARLELNPSVQVPGWTPDMAARETDLRDSVADDEQRLEAMQDDYVDGLLDRDAFARQQQRLGARLDQHRAELADLQRDRLAGNMPQTRDEFDGLWASIDDLDRRRAILGHFVRDLFVYPHPEGVATHLTRRRSEDEDTYEQRTRQHLAEILAARVVVRWAW
jgi:site-specific DNA recombinase